MMPAETNPSNPQGEVISLRHLQVQVLDSPELNARAQGLLEEHHYLGAVKPVGERLLYAVSDAQGTWVAVLVFAAAALHLRGREAWIGWSGEQRRRRLALVVNNVRFLLLPKPAVPKNASGSSNAQTARPSWPSIKTPTPSTQDGWTPTPPPSSNSTPSPPMA